MLTVFKEVLDYGQTKKAVCDAHCPSGTDFVCIVACGTGAARMCECVLAELYERGEGLSRRSDVPSRCTCSSSGLRTGLYLTTMIADAVTFSGRVVALPLLVTSYRETGFGEFEPGRFTAVRARDYLPRIVSIPASSNASFRRGSLPTREVRNALSTVTIWDTLATESLGNPVRRAENCTFPGAEAHLRFVVKGTQTTVEMRLRFRASP